MRTSSARRRVLTISAVLAGGLALAGCGSDSEPPIVVESPTDTMSEEASEHASDPATQAPEADVDRLAAAVLDAASVPGFDDVEITGWNAERFTTYLNLTLEDFHPTGECAAAIDEINSFSAPARGGIAAHYVTNSVDGSAEPVVPGQAGSAGPEDSRGHASPATVVETLMVETGEKADPFAVYAELEDACGTLRSEGSDDAKATFTKLSGVNAVQLKISTEGSRSQTLYMGGTSVDGKYHAFTTVSMMAKDSVTDLFHAQRDALRDEFREN